MIKSFLRVLAALAALTLGVARSAEAQAEVPQAPAAAVQQPAAPPVTITPCKYQVDQPEALPPADSGPVLWLVELCFPKQDNTPFVDIETYLFYVKLQLRRSEPSKGVWVPFTDASEERARADFKELWDTNFLDDLSIRVSEVTFANGVVGKIVSYEMEERERVKIITYEGSKQIDRSKVEEQLRDRNLAIAADSMLDEKKIAQVKTVVREMMSEKGFSPEVTHTIEPVQGQLKTVNLTFHINEGRKVKIRRVEFINNAAMSDRKLRKQIKDNKPTHMLTWILGGGVWNATKFEDDAERVREYYHNNGYASATIGQPQLKVLEDSKDGKTQWVELQVPVTEGKQYVFGTLDFDGNTRFRSEGLSALYAIKPGETYSRKKLVEGYRKAQDLYGGWGFMEFTALPELMRSDSPTNPETALTAMVPEALAVRLDAGAAVKPPHVDVTVRVTEGEQFYVRRLVFTGNTTTRDHVIRRELGALLEGAPFDSRALREGVRRLTQLGYFKEIEGSDKDVKVEKTAGTTNAVDITMKLEEQNRNQLTFGAGVSQYEGFFGQLAFQTSNFLGRGETFNVSLQAGARAQNFQVGFNKPFLFDTNMTGGFALHKRALQYVGYYTQRTQGGQVVVGAPLRAWTKFFLTYSYEQVRITDLNEALFDTSCIYSSDGCSTISSLTDLSQLNESQLEMLRRNPFVYDSLLIGQGGSRTISKVTPAIIKNTVNHPVFPSSGLKYSASIDLAVFGGNTQYYKPRLEGIWYFPHTSRTTLGLRGLFEYIQPKNSVASLPVFERLFLGGEYSVRGFDIRSIGPTVPNSLVVLGGNKSLLFNAEYSFRIAEPVRLIAFYDAGQVRDFGEPFTWQENLTRYVVPQPAPVVGLFPDLVRDPNAPGVTTEIIGRTSAFKTSTGIEVRFFMPVLNVPFRLIYAFNPQRLGVLDNNLQPAKDQVFKFSVGTTF
jgi:outer membrane protein insertion porin family